MPPIGQYTSPSSTYSGLPVGREEGSPMAEMLRLSTGHGVAVTMVEFVDEGTR